MPSDTYLNYADLAAHEKEGADYRITVLRRQSPIAIIAPHGGGIEPHAAHVAASIAGNEFNLYLFEGIKRQGNRVLHITSRCFDEPLCLALLEACDSVVAVHGYTGYDEAVLLGGLDEDLKARIAKSLRAAGFEPATAGHQFPGTEPTNICNRCRTGRGVQIQLSRHIRDSEEKRARLAQAVRAAL